MVPDISEFSFGFALTREIANFAGVSLRAAPVFPTQYVGDKSGVATMCN